MKPEISIEEHQRVLACGTDVPEQRPGLSMDIDEVGISEKTVWIRLPQGMIPFQAEICVDLPGRFRGIHMSRMEEAVSSLYQERFEEPGDYARKLAVEILGRQQGSTAAVRIRGRLPAIRRALVSSKESVDAVEVGVKARARDTGNGTLVEEWLGLGLCHMTACPCTQLYTRELEPEGHRRFPLPTHSQRSITWLWVENGQGRVGTRDLFECLEEALHATQDLLKRPDEAELVLRAHRMPQFAEDAVRGVAERAGKRLRRRLPLNASVKVVSTSLESIHLHNVKATLNTTLGEILEATGSK